jgi:hypothetical protein
VGWGGRKESLAFEASGNRSDPRKSANSDAATRMVSVETTGFLLEL